MLFYKDKSVMRFLNSFYRYFFKRKKQKLQIILMISLFALPISVFSEQTKQMRIDIVPDYMLTPSNVKIICTAIYSNLSSESLNKLDSLSHVPYSCKLNSEGNQNHLIITLSLK